jgi:hypothetical protein
MRVDPFPRQWPGDQQETKLRSATQVWMSVDISRREDGPELLGSWRLDL